MIFLKNLSELYKSSIQEVNKIKSNSMIGNDVGGNFITCIWARTGDFIFTNI